MLTEVRNQIKVIFLSLKYNIMREMTNKVTFLSNVLFMILNNSSFIIQWVVLFSLKQEIGGYTMKEIILLWGMASGTFGISRIVFSRAFELSELIIEGKLDTFLVQPKNVFLSAITSETKISAIGDLIYGYICLFVYGVTIKNFVLFTIFLITGGIIVAAFASIVNCASFWIVKGDFFADALSNIMIDFATYPGNIFKEGVKILFYTVIPVGLSNYLPVETILNFNFFNFAFIVGFTIAITILAFFVFYKGLKRYSSSNLMSSRI